ncbi:MAG TPA: nucleoside deaminase [Rhodanobacteraceae bacterium]
MKSGTCQNALPTVPKWIASEIDLAHAYPSPRAQVRLAIELARLNVEHATGGPFGAAVLTADGHVVAVGVNRVEPLRSSLAHAEIIALVGAQQRLGRARLNGNGRRYTLATSAQPCCQCYGALIWAGLDALVIGARSTDTQALAGFDEGPLPADWIDALTQRGIAVTRDVERAAACTVLAAYRARGGTQY